MPRSHECERGTHEGVRHRPGSVEEVTILVRQVRFSCRNIERDTETRPVPNVDEAAVS